MDPELSALTSPAVTTVVQLLATAAWEQPTTAVGGLWRRASGAGRDGASRAGEQAC
jgi:hypothetical protein